MPKEEMRESPAGRSQLSLFRQCNRKWAFKYLKGWRPPTEEYGPLHFGSVIHEVQAVLYEKKSYKKAKLEIEKQVPLPDPEALAYEKRKSFRDKVDIAFQKWYDKIGENDLINMEILEVEKELPLQLSNGYVMTVRLDRLLRNPETGEIFINDTKTTGASLEKALEQYLRHDQPRLYIAAVRQNYPEYRDALSGWRTDVLYCRAAPKKPGGYSTRTVRSDIVSFTEEEIEDAVLSYTGLVDDIAGKLNYVGNVPLAALFPADYDRCNDYYRACPFMDICTEIDRQEEPPANLELDPWLAEGTVLDLFKEV